MVRQSTVYFHRDFAGFTGGHLKVWDYFQHVKSSDKFNAEIFFSPQSSWINNPWYEFKDNCLQVWNPEEADILFLAGLDWLALTEQQRVSPPTPVVNLIQSVRHADKNNQLFNFLKFPATRICVSQEVADAIINTGIVNGPVIVNTNGIDHSLLPDIKSQNEKDIPLLIVGNKNPDLAKKISSQLMSDGINCNVLIDYILRDDFLSLVNRAKTTLLLPVKNEGFYLPALEAMCLNSLVICPDCIGNRSFCLEDKTCLLPNYEFEYVIEALRKALNLTTDEKSRLLNSAFSVASDLTIKKEREKFLFILSGG